MKDRQELDEWENRQDPTKHSRFCKSLPSRKTSDLLVLLIDREALWAAIGSRYQFAVSAAAQEIFAEIDRRLPARENPLNLQAVARVWPEGGEHKHEADEQLLIEYDVVRAPGGAERFLAIATVVRGVGIGVHLDDCAYQPGGTVVFDVIDIWRSGVASKLPVVSHEEAARRICQRLLELNRALAARIPSVSESRE